MNPLDDKLKELSTGLVCLVPKNNIGISCHEHSVCDCTFLSVLAMLRKCREQREVLRTWYVDELTHMRPIERHTKLDEDKKHDDAELLKIAERGEE